MKKGDIIRKTMSCEGFIEYGPYMRIISVNRNNNFVAVERLSGNRDNIIVLKDRIKVIKHSCVLINHEMFTAIRRGRRTLSHIASAQWLKMYNNLPILIQLRDFDFSEIMLFKINNMKKRKGIWQDEEIYIELGERLL